MSELLLDPAAWLVLFFGLAPVAFNTFVVDVQTQMLLVSAYFTLAWAAYFYIAVCRRTVNLWLGLASALFMLGVGIPIGRFLHFNVLSVFYDMTASSNLFVQWVGNVLSHGLNEEVMKAMSVLLLAFPLRQVKKPIDGIFYGALSGLGFAAWEGHKLIGEAQTPALMMMTVMIRSVTNCLLHASYTGISGYFIAIGALGRRRVALPAAGISIAILLHGSFDFRADSRDGFPLSLLLGAVTYLLFRHCVARSFEDTGDERSVTEGTSTWHGTQVLQKQPS
jgi:RsiW-degrading membrane proteinase PrsW (M82 family)